MSEKSTQHNLFLLMCSSCPNACVLEQTGSHREGDLEKTAD